LLVFEASGLNTLTLIDVPAGIVTSRIFGADEEAVDSGAFGCAAAADEAADFVSAAAPDSGVCGWPGGLVCEHAAARPAAIVTSKIDLIICVLPPGGAPPSYTVSGNGTRTATAQDDTDLRTASAA